MTPKYYTREKTRLFISINQQLALKTSPVHNTALHYIPYSTKLTTPYILQVKCTARSKYIYIYILSSTLLTPAPVLELPWEGKDPGEEALAAPRCGIAIRLDLFSGHLTPPGGIRLSCGKAKRMHASKEGRNTSTSRLEVLRRVGGRERSSEA